jgi:MarR-like DNA-binding transcriptional regulator SgrR of sgrS sRNA
VLPVSDFLGVADPHQARGPSQRLAAQLAHCQLLGRDARGRVVRHLAGKWRWDGDALTLRLTAGARFHDGTPITAGDAAASLARLQALQTTAPLGPLVGQLRATVPPAEPLTLVLTAPRGAKRQAVERLLARAEVAVLRGGQPGPGRGCGPYRPERVDGEQMLLRAFEGHPVGRPRLDALVLRRLARADEQVQQFTFRALDLCFEASHRLRRVPSLEVGARSTVFLVPAPALRGPAQRTRRRAIAAAATGAPLGRYVGWDVALARGPWPQGLAPSDALIPRGAPSLALERLVIAYPAGHPELESLAVVLRDRLAAELPAGTEARAVALPGLTFAAAAGAERAPWDLALVLHDWAATTRDEAAWEAAQLLGGGGLTPAAVLSGRIRGWAQRVIEGARLIAVVHVRRPVFHRPPLHLSAAPGLPDLAEAWLR